MTFQSPSTSDAQLGSDDVCMFSKNAGLSCSEGPYMKKIWKSTLNALKVISVIWPGMMSLNFGFMKFL